MFPVCTLQKLTLRLSHKSVASNRSDYVVKATSTNRVGSTFDVAGSIFLSPFLRLRDARRLLLHRRYAGR